ncbi:MAG TPA: translational GTPase TypA [Clostridiales bacterium]|nr:translational GTPase TypA [Clostridiales bacterium]
MKNEKIRNVAIIAHVDHGKTTLVDSMLKQSGLFRENQAVNDRMMDSNDIERERGITILAKNTAVEYKGYKINIVDTPGHADFSGEVERILKMVDGVLLLVDAYEGPMPQTRFVLRKALDMGLKAIVVINKIDRPDARCDEVADEILDLFIDLDTPVDNLEYPLVYASSRDGYAVLSLEDPRENMSPLFDIIIKEIPAPEGDAGQPLQMLISSVDYDVYTGRIGIGKIQRGTAEIQKDYVLCNVSGKQADMKITAMYQFKGLSRIPCEKALAGDIIAISGIDDISIGDTICDVEAVEPLAFVKIDEPSISMMFLVNDSPFAGREGEYVTSRHLRRRLFREKEKDVSLRVEETDSADTFQVFGRGELHLSVLIENMRREGYEFQVSKPFAIIKDTPQGKMEPFEKVYIDVPEQYMGLVIEKLGSRKGEIISMEGGAEGFSQLQFIIPARGLLGYRQEFLTDTRGMGIMYSSFHEYAPYKGEIPSRSRGSLVAFESGTAVTYGLFNAQQRGNLIIKPGVEVYEGMVVGINSRSDDMVVNVCKKKHLTSVRNVQAEDPLKLLTPVAMSLEQTIEFIKDDELIEVTPKSFRIRKKILKKETRERALRKVT